ncbi:MAG TPA: lysophospholipase [Magnetospirillum sp.]|jgi:alpha-beta hydrolase superfamily lysophospholipase|nr:lysophospholipase [Magnetospirillum sp.]
MTAKALASFLLALLLSACAAQYQLPGPMVAAPQLNHDHWLSADGVRLPLRGWMPDGPPKAVVLALHGMNDYSNFFDEPGHYLAKKGIAAYAYDQRGFGQGPRPGTWSSAEAMAADLREVAALVAARHPGVPLYLLGESMGGAVVMLAAADHPPQVKGIILSAPAVWGRSSMGFFQRAALWLAYQVAPGWELTGEGLHIKPSDNIPMLRKLAADPLVIKATRVDAVNGLVDLMDTATEAAPRVHLPALVLYGEKDEIVPADPTWSMIQSLPDTAGSQRVALYKNGYHMLLRDLQADVVLDDIAAWISDPSQPLPSKADTYAQDALAKRREG